MCWVHEPRDRQHHCYSLLVYLCGEGAMGRTIGGTAIMTTFADILASIGGIWGFGVVAMLCLTDEYWHTIVAWPIVAVRRAWKEER